MKQYLINQRGLFRVYPSNWRINLQDIRNYFFYTLTQTLLA